jgi:endonuclease YncB( thermonuclease family)
MSRRLAILTAMRIRRLRTDRPSFSLHKTGRNVVLLIPWVLAFAMVLGALPAGAQDLPQDAREYFAISGKVSGVVSGADIVVSGKSVRLEGTRAPKRGRACLRNGESVDIGSEVAEGLARRIVGSEASLTVHADENGRLVGRGVINGQDIGEIAISNGFAVTKIGDYSYAAQEREARNNRPGLWSCSSFPKTESVPETAAVAAAPQDLPPPMEVKPRPSAKARNAIDYLPSDPALPPQPGEEADDFDLVLDDVGGFFENIFSGIDRTIRDVFGAPPPAPRR